MEGEGERGEREREGWDGWMDGGREGGGRKGWKEG